MQKQVLSLNNVSYHYNRGLWLSRSQSFTALSDISFDVYQGETLGIVGRNGAGKSTLLRILTGIVQPSTGSMTNYGHTTSLLSLSLGMDPQLSGTDNAILSALLLGFSKAEAEKNLSEIKEFSELGNFMNEPVKSYSSGMRTRLGFSIAIHLQPDILLIDEVLGVGDVEFRKKSSQALRGKITSNQTVVLISHQAAQIKALCDRVVWIEKGIVRKTGQAEEIMDEYEEYLLTPVERTA